jgi:dolichol-phosphate mannosyltransferase
MQPAVRETLPSDRDPQNLREAEAPAPEISVIVPCFNEEGNVELLLEELADALQGIGVSHEILLVDDASTDGTARRVREAMPRYPALRLIQHRLNCGESAAILSGCACARGAILVTLDADLQDDPADLPMMIRELEGCDCVAGVRRERKDSFARIASSRVANWFRDLMLGDGIHDAGCTFRAFRRPLLECVVPFRGLHRFAPTIWRWQGFRVKEVAIHHRPRHAGVSKYGTLNRLWVGLDDIFGMRWFHRRFVPPGRCVGPSADEQRRGK